MNDLVYLGITVQIILTIALCALAYRRGFARGFYEGERYTTIRAEKARQRYAIDHFREMT